MSARTKRPVIEREPPLHKTPVTLPRYMVEHLDRVLDGAQDKVMLTLERIPRLRGLWGPTAAISVHEDIRIVRDQLAKLLEVAP